MSQPFLTEIRVFSFNFAPKGWAQCNGQLLPINQNQATFSLLGTTYGGDGRVNFGLPNLQGRVPMHTGNNHILGERGGEANHTLTVNEIPTHTHALNATNVATGAASPLNNVIATVPTTYGKVYSDAAGAAAPDTSLNAGSVAGGGGSQPHTNIQPYAVFNICIALQGIFPSPN